VGAQTKTPLLLSKFQGVLPVVPEILDFYKVFFRDMEIGELNAEELRFRAARRVV
jgi:hypothetical protein